MTIDSYQRLFVIKVQMMMRDCEHGEYSLLFMIMEAPQA